MQITQGIIIKLQIKYKWKPEFSPGACPSEDFSFLKIKAWFYFRCFIDLFLT